jgi:tRNA-2-methylthio-N6-dimethylallyladenosine synthase
VPKEVVQERFERLVALQNQISYEENLAQIGREVEVLVANGEGRKDSTRDRLTGRARDSRLVHFDVPAGSEIPRPGDLVTVTVTEAGPYHLIADSTDGSPLKVRRTRAGDAWDRAQAESCGVPVVSGLGLSGASSSTGSSSTGGATNLGMPTLRVARSDIYDVNDGER